MTKEELLAKAKRDYPIGTEFISPHDHRTSRKIEVEDLELYDGETSVISGKGGWYICDHGRWGEITNRVIPKELPIFN